MGETLTIASQKQAYTLSDRGTYLATKNLDLRIVSEGQRGAVQPLPRHRRQARRHQRGLRPPVRPVDRVEPPTQQEIGRFGVKQYGQRLFVPDARP